MSTRGVKNEDRGRKWVGMIANMLEGKHFDESTPQEQIQTEFDTARKQVIDWLRDIENGGDPAEVIFGGKAYMNDRHSRAIAQVIQARINTGMTQGEAIRSVAKHEGEKVSTVKSIFIRWRDKIDKDTPLG